MAGFDSFAPSVCRNPGQPAGFCLQSSHCGLTYDSDRKGTKERQSGIVPEGRVLEGNA